MAHQGYPSTSLVPDLLQPRGMLPRVSVAHALFRHSSGPQRIVPLTSYHPCFPQDSRWLISTPASALDPRRLFPRTTSHWSQHQLQLLPLKLICWTSHRPCPLQLQVQALAKLTPSTSTSSSSSSNWLIKLALVQHSPKSMCNPC